MTDYLPEVYQNFERRFPTVKEAFDALGAAEHDAGPLGEREPVTDEIRDRVRPRERHLLGPDVELLQVLDDDRKH